jgi:purine-cytosine permease-like protein
MSEQPPSNTFWLGNAILAVAMFMLLFMGSAWETLGISAMVLWIALVALGVYLVMQKNEGS